MHNITLNLGYKYMHRVIWNNITMAGLNLLSCYTRASVRESLIAGSHAALWVPLFTEGWYC